tara:strand:+ start:2992 stop:3375 length:384 start_codon:yes stop_codon:yes gene_type:complete
MSFNNNNLISNTKYIKRIYSDFGIFEIKNDIINRLYPNDKKIESISINGIELLIDNSIINKKIVNTIPINHILIELQEIEYKIDIKDNISFILQYKNNNIYDAFFRSKFLDNNILDKIKEYLNLIIF